MTGYGKAECELKDRKVIVEVKSLNSKNLDLYTKIPGIYREKELEIRNLVSKKLLRGKVEFVLYYEVSDENKATTINSGVIKNYVNQLKELTTELNLQSEQLLQMAIRLPDTLNTEKEEIDENEWKIVISAVETALDQLDDFRTQEGKYLKDDIEQRIKAIEKRKNEITPFELDRTEKIKSRLKEGLNKSFDESEYDKNRFEQELIYYIEKLDITEEKVRLTNHCNYFLEMLNESESNGKKLGFISQEIGREINTIGSKANDSDIQKLVVLMKDELEKIKEQMLNIL